MEPEEPFQSDCCGNGCSPCVFDIYQESLKKWKEKCQKESSSDEANFRTDLLSQTRFKPFKLIEMQQLTEEVFLYKFQPFITNQAIEIIGYLPYDVGQHFILRCDINNLAKSFFEERNRLGDSLSAENIIENAKSSVVSGKDSMVIRAYTPITLAKEEKNCCFSIFVKLYKNGIASEYFRGLRIGDISFWRGPYGSFTYEPNSFKCILMLCIGSGLAPMISLINFVLDNEHDETILKLLYGIKNIDHIIMRNNLQKMAQYWNFTLQYFFSECKAENKNIKFGENFTNKRIDIVSVKEIVNEMNKQKMLVLICGTENFISSMKSIVTELGVDTDLNFHIF